MPVDKYLFSAGKDLVWDIDGLKIDSISIDSDGSREITLVDNGPGSYINYSQISSAPRRIPRIEKTIFNPPATIIIWTTGEKTIVKCAEGETFDPEKGFAMAIAKKALGKDYKKAFKILMEGLDVD